MMQMQEPPWLDGAFHQTQAMARALGVNLTTAGALGLLPNDAPGRMIARCQGCAFSEVCTVWLSECCGAPPRAPDFCVNKEALDRLAAQCGAP